MKSLLSLTITGMLTAALAVAQVQDRFAGVRVSGEIVSNNLSPAMLTVELSAGQSGRRLTAMVNSDGTFEFDSAAPGTYELRITGAAGVVIHQELVNISGPAQRISIRLPDTVSANRAAGDTVSLQQLQHKVPGPARKAFEKGQSAARKQNWPEAEKLFRRALDEDPEFADAYNELGVVEVSVNRLPDAARNFQKAIDVAPEHRLALPNLCIVLAKMKNYHDAGDVARRALRVAPQLNQLRMILGISLMVGHGDPEEALANLQRAEAEFPKAHLLEAQVLAGQGRNADAAQHLEEYLRVGDPDQVQRRTIEADLARLQNRPSPKE